MNKKIRKIMEKAGFVFWGDEPWKPDGAVVDWSCDYDRDMKKFVELLVEDIANRFVYTTDTREQMLSRYLDK